MKITRGDRAFGIINGLFLILIAAACLYPLIHVINGSFSDPLLLQSHTGLLLTPDGFTTKAYEVVFKRGDIYTGYCNTIFLVLCGTAINLVMTSCGAFLLSRQKFIPKNFLMLMVVITMYFSGGLIPTFLLYKNTYQIYNSHLALLLPGAISSWNLIVMRTSFQGIPRELEESAYIDGANDFVVLIRVILPLSTATIAVMALFYGVSHWNSWFAAMIYLEDRSKYPLQLFLREMLVLKDGAGVTTEEEMLAENLKYATIVVATVPILFIYPFIQRYFVKGVMVGALKG